MYRAAQQHESLTNENDSDFYRLETENDSLQSTIDMLLNV